jgi:hypothetical protein
MGWKKLGEDGKKGRKRTEAQGERWREEEGGNRYGVMTMVWM